MMTEQKSSLIRPVRRSLLIKRPDQIWPPLKAGEDLKFCKPTPVDPGIYRGPGHFAAYYRGGEDAHRFWQRAQAEAPLTLETVINNHQFQIDLESGLKFRATGT